MTLQDAIDIKAMGVWGQQDGLLSASEMVLLYKTMYDYGIRSCLEIGHYNGLSTAVLNKACDHVTSIDAHIDDAWVHDSSERVYAANLQLPIIKNIQHTSSIIMDSTAIKSIYGFDAVFYDGDHGEEQQRFTDVVQASPDVKLFVFDDADFRVPEHCLIQLKVAGWVDRSPQLRRLEGDKQNPETMTLAVMTR